jgi:16S rRNA processing protein RimM
MPDYVEVGYTQKTHGVKGELKFFVEDPFFDLIIEKNRVFLDIKGVKVPYFIKEIRGAEGNIIHFDDVPNREAALLLQSRKMYLPASEVPEDLEMEPEGPAYAGLTGFMLVDAQAGPVGPIEEVLEMPQQEMALVRYKGRETLIPLNTHFIQGVDTERREVLVDLPDGLLEP